MISIPLPATTPRRKAAKRATAICASNIVIVLVKHWSCDLGFAVFRSAIFMRRQDLAEAQFGDLERRDLFHAGGSRCRCGRIALNLGLQALANRPPDRRRSTRGRADRGGATKAAMPGSGVLRLLRRQLELVGHS